MQNFQVSKNTQFTKIEEPVESGGLTKFCSMVIIDFSFYLILWAILIIIVVNYFNFTNQMDNASNTIFLFIAGWWIILFFLIAFVVLGTFSILLLIATIKSINVFNSPPNQRYFKRELGARDAGYQENRLIELTCKRFARPGVNIPQLYLIIDNPEFIMQIYGEVLVVSSQRIEDDDFPAYLAHELGHYNSSDAKLRLAIHFYKALAISRIFFFKSGSWAKYFQERDFLADKFADKLGQRGGLIDALESVKLLEAPFDEKEDEVPPAELRINKLRYRSW